MNAYYKTTKILKRKKRAFKPAFYCETISPELQSPLQDRANIVRLLE